MTLFKNILSKFLIFNIFLALLACSGKNVDSFGREEISFRTKDASSDGLQALISEADEKYQSESYNLAFIKYQSIADSYPRRKLTDVRYRLVSLAYERQRYAEVDSLAKDFLKLNPDSALAPEVLLFAGKAKEKQYGGAGRDTKPLKEASQFYKRLAREYEGTKHQQVAKKSLARIKRKMSEHRSYISSYYAKSGNTAAAEARSR